jgi:hypothetical protein
VQVCVVLGADVSGGRWVQVRLVAGMLRCTLCWVMLCVVAGECRCVL